MVPCCCETYPAAHGVGHASGRPVVGNVRNDHADIDGAGEEAGTSTAYGGRRDLSDVYGSHNGRLADP